MKLVFREIFKTKGKNEPITVVSGLPRGGTSLMMQMLEAGGMPIATDSIREPDEDNPRGYCEFEKVKKIKEDASCENMVKKYLKVEKSDVFSL